MKTLPKLAVLTIVGSGLLATISVQDANAARRVVRKSQGRTVVRRHAHRPLRIGFVSPMIPFGYRFLPTYGWNYRNGVADIIRARGQAALLRSRSAINNQKAYKKALENRLRRIQVRMERKRIGAGARKAYYAKQRETRNRYLAVKRAETAKRLAATRAGEIANVNTSAPDSPIGYKP